MNHDEVTTRLSALIDHELAADEVARVTAHLAECVTCQQTQAAMISMRNWLQRDALQTIPEDLAARLAASLAEAKVETAAPARPVSLTAQPKPAKRQWPGWLWPGLSTLGGALAGALLVAMLLPQAPSAQTQLAQEVLSGHIRALQVDHLADVISTDQHTVKPWFAGKLDFSPPVHDLASAGFPLAGGRLDYLQQRPVAALVYRYRLHVINVYMWPATSVQPTTVQTRQGYQILAWQQESMNCWAVSDLNAADLQRFASLLRAAG